MKKLSLLFALICVSVMGWADTPYCQTPISDGKILYTCASLGEGNYTVVLEGTSSCTITGCDNCNWGINDINGVPGGSALSFNYSSAGYGSLTATFTCASTPNKPYVAYSAIATSQGQVVINECPKDMDWTTTCSGGGGGGGEEPEGINWSEISWLSGSNDTYKLYITPDFSDQYGGKKVENSNLWIGFPSAEFGEMSIEPNGGENAAWKTFALSNFPDQENQFTVVCGGTTYTLYVYNGNAGGGGGGEEPQTIDWSDVSYLSGSSQYKAVVDPAIPNNFGIQDVHENAVYVTFPDAVFDFTSLNADNIVYRQLGSGMFFDLANFAAVEELSFTINNHGTDYTLTVHNDNPIVAPAAKADSPAKSAQQVRAISSQYVLNTGMVRLGWSGGSRSDVLIDGRITPTFTLGNQLGLGFGYINISSMDKLHMDIWTADSYSINICLVSSGAGEHNYSQDLTGGEWNSVDIAISEFQANNSAVEAIKLSGSAAEGKTVFLDNIYFYADNALSDPDPSNVPDVNFALRTNGAIAYPSSVRGENFAARAIDGDNGTMWESEWDQDPQSLTFDLGQRRIFNTIQMRLFERYASNFYIETSNNGVDWTEAKAVTGYSNENANNYELTISLDNNVTARYIRFRGVTRANGYGYALYEFRVLLAGTPVLTSVELVSDKNLVKTGAYATLTASPKDQNGSAIVADISYSVSPSDAGHVTDGKYYPDKYGLATITVTASAGGEEVSNNVQVWGVVGNNLAANNALSADGTYTSDGGDAHLPAKAVDGNDGTWWQGSAAGESGAADDAARTYDAYFTVDLGASYSLQLIKINFDGACSDKYKIKVSTNNTDWADAYTYDQVTGNYRHNKYISTADLNNSDNVRYLKFYSTKASTQWGVKIYEIEVYGTEASTAKTVSASVSPESTGYVLITTGNPAVEVTEPVESGTSVTFTAVPDEGYEFVNWTLGGDVVSTNPEYELTITANTALVANFDYARTTYCHQEVLTSGGKKVYLTVGKGAAEGTYQVIIEGSSELTITGINNANTAINHVKYLSYDGNDVPMNVANEGWKFENTGYGVIKSAEIRPQTGYSWRDIYMWRPDLYIGTSAGEQNINSILDNQHYFNWDNDCADATAPVMAAPTAAVLNTTDVRLTLSATDNWEGPITYNINYKPTGAEGDGVNAETSGASGATITYDIDGLTTNTEYTFTVTAKDVANNVCAAQSCTATPAGDVVAPTNVSITAVALTNTVVRLTLSADDDYAGDITYNITYDNAGAASTSAARGTSTTLDITGLTADTEYHFSVTATDAANNTSAAVNALAVRTYATNLALNKPSYAGAEVQPGNMADDSNDGNKDSRWASGGSAVHGNDVSTSQDWWYVDLGHVYDIKNIRMYWEGARPSKYKFFTSNDATNWTEIANILVSPEYSADASKVMDYLNDIDANAQGRYLKVWGYEDTNNNWAYGISFWEFEAYGSLAVDAVAPVISSFTADGASTTSVVLKATATDNFNGDLTYTFYCNDVALADPVVKASGVEATYVVNELSMGTNYNFKVNVSDGVNNTMSDVVVGSPINDAQAPADVTVTSVATHNSITLTLSATDNLGGMIYYTATCGETVKNAQAVSGESVEVTFDGLDYSTPYAFSIVAKDGSNNEAEPVAHNKTTLRLPYPTSAAPAPAFAEASVRPVFSSAYNKDCNFYDWGSSSVEKQNYGAKKLSHEAAFFGIADFGTIKVDADDELYLSVWTNEDISFRVVPIIHNAEESANLPERGAFTQTLTGGQWNEVHFTMSDFVLNDVDAVVEPNENYDKIYQIKIDRADNQTFWLDNIYFRRKGALSDEGSNADFIAANNNEGQDVVLNRTILANDGWYTLCVPFDMDADKVVEVFGNSTIAEMTGAEDRGSLIHLNFDYVNAIEAGHPYLIQPGISFTEGSIISGVTIKNVTPIVAGNDLMHFQGVYNATMLTDENIRFVADDNYLYSPAVGGTEMGAFRCYFTIPDGSSALAPGKRAKVVMGPQTATDIDSVQSSAISIQKVLRDGQLLIIREGRVYSAQGQILK